MASSDCSAPLRLFFELVGGFGAHDMDVTTVDSDVDGDFGSVVREGVGSGGCICDGITIDTSGNCAFDFCFPGFRGAGLVVCDKL
jgi:hypothetical protein